MSGEKRFIIGPGPHVHASETTAKIMWWVNGTLILPAGWGVWVFGWHAVAIMIASIAGAVGSEAAVAWLSRRPRTTVGDGSAFCTGLLLALTLPPLLPPWMAFVGGAFSILVGKTIFGGLGFNLFNPALVGRAFMLATFPQPMTTGWERPHGGLMVALDATTTATPLSVLREQGSEAAMRLVSGPNPWAGFALGFRPGSLGEVSVLMIGLAAAVLLVRGIIRLTIPVSIFAGVFLTTLGTGAPLLHLVTGGLWLGAFFMATDYVTSPTTRNGQIIFGLVIGALTGLIRVYGGYPEGICYAILIANTLVPALNMWFRPVRTQLAGSPS